MNLKVVSTDAICLSNFTDATIVFYLIFKCFEFLISFEYLQWDLNCDLFRVTNFLENQPNDDPNISVNRMRKNVLIIKIFSKSYSVNTDIYVRTITNSGID